jgi:prepilin-type N-terminal cleavage/methylation domain-containing protein
MRHSRGFTLIELLVAMVIMLIVTGSIYTLLNTTQRVSRAQAERVDLQSNVRAGSIVVPNELREINNVEGALVGGPQVDILGVPSATTLQYRAMRGIGFVCEVPTTGLVKILKSTWSGLRDPVATRDAGYVFLEGSDPDVSTDDGWQAVVITGVNSSTCVAANDAWAFTISPTVAALTAVPIPVGTPVRLYEVMELSLYANGGKSWLGARSVSGLEASPQPVLGPLVDATGLAFKYLDKTGVQTALMSNVKSIRLTIRGITDHAIVKGGSSGAVQQVDDSLVSEVLLRNAFRP